MQRSIPILWGLVIILLILNLLLLDVLNLARLTAIETLNEVEATLDNLANEVIVYNIEVNQAVPIKADVPFNQTMDIPLNTVIPIDQVLTMPFQMGASEIELDVPVKTDFPIDTVIPVAFNQTITVDTVVQLDTTLPVEIDIAQTPLANYLRQAKLDIAQLRSWLALQGEAVAVEGTVVVTLDDETRVNAVPASAGNLQSQVVAVEAVTTAAPVSEETQSDTSDVSQPSADPLSLSDNAASQPDPGWCAHAYWPLRPGTAWTYNSADTSYSQHVDNVLNNEVYLSTQYEGRNIQFNLVCYQEGLGGSYLGDMRRITELGNLNFSNPRGIFLPHPEVIEKIGNSWTQEYDVTGTIEARQEDRPVVGHISHGRAVAVYTPTGFETLKTPLGPREALRIEQKLDLELDIDFSFSSQTMPATEIVKLTTVYWFVKGIGPVRVHWQGGTIQQDFEIGETAVNQLSSIPALAEEHLMFVCILSEEEASECMRIAGISQADLTIPPETELEIQGFILPNDFSKDETTNAIEPGSNELSERPTSANKSSGEPTPEEETESDSEQAALLAYAEAVAKLGEKITEAGEKFGASALAYRNGELTLDEFRSKFSSFKPKIQGFIQEVDKVSPPPEAEDVHQKLTSGLDMCNEAVGLMDEWFDTQDGGTKEATALLVASCIDQVEEAGDELETLVGSLPNVPR